MKCLIFDCDGVLVDSEIITTQHFIKQLEKLGYQLTMEASLKRFTGLSAKAVYQTVGQDMGRSLSTEQIEDIQAQVHAGIHSEVRAITGISGLLDALQNNTQLSFCLASSGSLEKINKSLEVTQLLKFFTSATIFSSQHVKNGKPSPDLFLFAAEKMGARPQDCIVIEDSEAGIQAAVAAKMKVIGFLGGSHALYTWYQEKIKTYKIPIANDVTELAALLDELI